MKKKIFTALIVAAAATPAFAEVTAASTKTTTTKEAVTAQDQNTNAKDTEVTRRIREQIVNDKSLGMSTKNITIVTQNGHVVLKGNVATAEDKVRVETIAKKTAGAQQVVNDTQVMAAH